MNHTHRMAAAIAFAAGLLAPVTAPAQSVMAPADAWHYNVILYGYLPSIGGALAFPNAGNPAVKVDASTLLDSLDMAFMGTFDMHNGRWGLFTDVLYMDVSGSASKTRDFT